MKNMERKMHNSEKDPSAYIWTDLVNESVHTSDDKDIGDIDAMNENFIVVKRGFVNIHYYYIPMKYVEGWDGFVVWLTITEDLVKQKFERDEIPNPYEYYIKEYSSYFSPVTFPTLTMLSARYNAPLYNRDRPEQIYICPLCGNRSNDKSGLSRHIETMH